MLFLNIWLFPSIFFNNFSFCHFSWCHMLFIFVLSLPWKPFKFCASLKSFYSELCLLWFSSLSLFSASSSRWCYSINVADNLFCQFAVVHTYYAPENFDSSFFANYIWHFFVFLILVYVFVFSIFKLSSLVFSWSVDILENLCFCSNYFILPDVL